MSPRRRSAMTIRTYRITGGGRRIELSRHEISPHPGAGSIELTSVWPRCRCRRCEVADAVVRPDAETVL
ncbi:hypothetical protein P3T37_002425 [Kitasatospora sp. MAA4]|nr:hypothetical protein [Kitasatospora sp. MAA4]